MASYNIGLSTFYDLKKQKDHLRLFVALSESVKGLFKQQALRQGKVSFE
jgi:predicted XRE-type DNA-binding protein